MLRFAVERGQLQHNVVRDVRKLKTQADPPGWLTQEEWAKIKAIAEHSSLWPLVNTAYFTGMRSAELCHLTCGELNCAAGLVTTRNKPEIGSTLKSRSSRTIPLHSDHATILRPFLQVKKPTDLCFPSPDGDPYHDWEINEAFERHIAKPFGVACSLKHLRFTFASRLVQQGVSMYKVSQWLGHRPVTTTERHYAHLAPRDDEIEVL